MPSAPSGWPRFLTVWNRGGMKAYAGTILLLANAPVSERAEIPEQPDWSLDQLGALVGCLTSRH
jgi:hypothetical protein